MPRPMKAAICAKCDSAAACPKALWPLSCRSADILSKLHVCAQDWPRQAPSALNATVPQLVPVPYVPSPAQPRSACQSCCMTALKDHPDKPHLQLMLMRCSLPLGLMCPLLHSCDQPLRVAA